MVERFVLGGKGLEVAIYDFLLDRRLTLDEFRAEFGSDFGSGSLFAAGVSSAVEAPSRRSPSRVNLRRSVTVNPDGWSGSVDEPSYKSCVAVRASGGMGDEGGGAAGVVEYWMAFNGVRAHDPETVARAVVESGRW